MNPLQERKRQLLARSDACRASILSEIQGVKAATAWIPKGVVAIRTIYPALILAVPLIGYIFARKPSQNPSPPKRGFIASVLAGYQFFRQIKPVWDELRSRKSQTRDE